MLNKKQIKDLIYLDNEQLIDCIINLNKFLKNSDSIIKDLQKMNKINESIIINQEKQIKNDDKIISNNEKVEKLNISIIEKQELIINNLELSLVKVKEIINKIRDSK